MWLSEIQTKPILLLFETRDSFELTKFDFIKLIRTNFRYSLKEYFGLCAIENKSEHG